MKPLHTVAIVSACLILIGCQATQSMAQLQNFIPDTQKNIVKTDDFLLEMKSCTISAERTAECTLEITSLYQDRKAGLSYPKIQDNKGKEHRMNRKDGVVGVQTMVAGQPYTQEFVATNLPTYTTQVRSIVTGFVITDLRGIKIAERPIVFSNIPNTPATHQTTSITRPTTAHAPAPAPTKTSTHSNATLNNSYWHGIIVPVVNMPENEIMKLWKRGAYIHLRKDGLAGYNWSEPKNYSYHDFNFWKQNGSTFTLSMNGAVYTFDLNGQQDPLTAYLQAGGGFKMTMDRQ